MSLLSYTYHEVKILQQHHRHVNSDNTQKRKIYIYFTQDVEKKKEYTKNKTLEVNTIRKQVHASARDGRRCSVAEVGLEVCRSV